VYATGFDSASAHFSAGIVGINPETTQSFLEIWLYVLRNLDCHGVVGMSDRIMLLVN
jgi:hypothetical protein